ncbi:hypothetical protein [Nostoc sp.]
MVTKKGNANRNHSQHDHENSDRGWRRNSNVPKGSAPNGTKKSRNACGLSSLLSYFVIRAGVWSLRGKLSGGVYGLVPQLLPGRSGTALPFLRGLGGIFEFENIP